jgi:hypothetical protein
MVPGQLQLLSHQSPTVTLQPQAAAPQTSYELTAAGLSQQTSHQSLQASHQLQVVEQVTFSEQTELGQHLEVAVVESELILQSDLRG